MRAGAGVANRGVDVADPRRRALLRRAAAAGIAALGPGLARASDAGLQPEAREGPATPVVDAHAHPYQFFGGRSGDPTTPTAERLQQAGVTLCAFAAVGDMTFYPRRFGSPFYDTQGQLKEVERLEARGSVRVVRTASDLQRLASTPGAPGALVAIEGGDALEGDLGKLEAFLAQGVRAITLVHDRDNEIGFNQRSTADGPLTPFGVRLVERMNAQGVLVDVAHAKPGTLKGVVEVASLPLIDSHTSLRRPGEGVAGTRRLRGWQEMEWIARGGGVVCTWPFAYSGTGADRTTIRHWAAEIVEMKARIGIEHVGLGTDGGGGLPRTVDGWSSIASLPLLAGALRDAGLAAGDVAAFLGGNVLRVLRRTLA
jgi:microsomal dipeptidase-like Zn-dependent dipeptidase